MKTGSRAELTVLLTKDFLWCQICIISSLGKLTFDTLVDEFEQWLQCFKGG